MTTHAHEGRRAVATLTLSQEIDRPVADVFAIVADIGTFASWNPTIKSSRQLTSGEPRNGMRAEWQLKGFGAVTQELQEFEPHRRMRIVPLMKSLGGGHRFTFSDLGDRTRVDHELEMIPKGVFKLMAPMMRRTGRMNLRATADALKGYLERG
jgi:uncharacterized protein YndB with AHSA1/START domain